MRRVDFEFPAYGFKGTAIAFEQDSFERYIDESLRNGDDAAEGVLVRNVEAPGYEEIEATRARFPYLAISLCNLLVEYAGYVRDSAIFEEALREDTPLNVLRMAGLSPEEATKLCAAHPGEALRLVVVRDADRKKLFACVIRPDEEAARLIREPKKGNGKGFGKGCRSAALSAIVWSDIPPAEAFARWPAIPALCLADKIVEVAGANADRQFRGRR